MINVVQAIIQMPVQSFSLYNQQNYIIQYSPLLYNMEPEYLEEDQLSITIKPRNYKCPCSKTYLSYAALFTHIKQKHDGKPPGKIVKPPSLYQKRGRPPTKAKQQGRQTEAKQQSPTIVNYQQIFPPQTQQQKYQRLCLAEDIINELSQILQQMPIQNVNKDHLNQMQVFSQMSIYLNTRMNYINLINGNISIADALFQFTKRVCYRIIWKRFQPFYLLFMLFLKFITDEENNKKLLTEKTLDLFCQYVNDFIANHLEYMAQQFRLQNLWVFTKQNATKIFYHFFRWAMKKRYITFKIKLANQISQEISAHHALTPNRPQNTNNSFRQNPQQQGSESISYKKENEWQGNDFGASNEVFYQNNYGQNSFDQQVQ